MIRSLLSVVQCKQLYEEAEGKDGASSRGKTISASGPLLLGLKRAQPDQVVFGETLSLNDRMCWRNHWSWDWKR